MRLAMDLLDSSPLKEDNKLGKGRNARQVPLSSTSTCPSSSRKTFPQAFKG